jgi:hypothetical protein
VTTFRLGQSPETLEQFRRMGVPERLFPYCFEFRPDHPEVRIASMTGLTVEDLLLLANLGINRLVVRPRGRFDLQQLGIAIAGFKSIGLMSTGPNELDRSLQTFFTGVEVLEDAISLQELRSSAEINGAANLRFLPSLRSVYCVGDFALSAMDNPSVRDALIDVKKIGPNYAISAPLEKLVLYAGAGLANLPELQHPLSLISLVIGDARRFSAESLSSLDNLESLVFDACRELADVSALLRLHRLTSVQFVGVKVIRDAGVLEGMKVARFDVEGNHVFDDAFQLRVRDRDGWTFSRYISARNRPSTDDGQAAFIDSNEDVSYAPFRIRKIQGGTYLIDFDDWAGFASILGWRSDEMAADVAYFWADTLVVRNAPEIRQSGALVSDSEGGVLRLELPNAEAVVKVASTLFAGWQDHAQLRRIVKSKFPRRVRRRN